jgi:hypothetical protein
MNLFLENLSQFQSRSVLPLVVSKYTIGHEFSEKTAPDDLAPALV